ncbi:hypothetical protein [Rhizobium sp. BK176]|uniref:hypothetical protein n=1 Tax=Rhizobium sp. BK176 TaxID=2587071 RepID=UPI0021671649|nr:hypothetical protein [Rhizobium sp. BK176]MCS4089137.1 hypothetical protein [Rhizobium sp. BK176]
MYPHRAIITPNRTVLFHAAYWIAQTAIGEEDGGVADHYEYNGFGYRETFANQGGATPINVILDHLSSMDVVRRLEAAGEPDIEPAAEVTDEALPEIAKSVAAAWIGFLQQQFPEVPADKIAETTHDAEKAFLHYITFEQEFSKAYPAKPQATASGVSL